MANLRPMMFMGLIVLSYMMWVEWQKDYGPQPSAVTPATQTTQSSFDAPPPVVAQDDSIPFVGDLPQPESTASSMDQQTTAQAEMSSENSLLLVTTDVLEVGIDLAGGTMVSAKLLNYPVELEQTSERK